MVIRWLVVVLPALFAGTCASELDAACESCQLPPQYGCACVCGVDGFTYGNDCLATCQGVRVAHKGSCRSDLSCSAKVLPALTAQCRAEDCASDALATEVSNDVLRAHSLFRLVGTSRVGLNGARSPPGRAAPSENGGFRQEVIRMDRFGRKYVRVDEASSARRRGLLERGGGARSGLGARTLSGFVPGMPADALQDAAARAEDAAAAAAAAASAALLASVTESRRKLPRRAERRLLNNLELRGNGVDAGKRLSLLGGGQPDSDAVLQAHRSLLQRRSNIVVGEDNRVKVANPTSEFPFKSIGQLSFVNTNTSGTFLCTAALFSERHVITAAHCVYDPGRDTFQSDWAFAPGQTETQAPFGQISYEYVDVFISQYDANVRDWDIAIITLTQAVGLRTGWMGVKSLPPPGLCNPAPFVLPNLELVGYPVQANGAHTQWASFCDLKVKNGCEHFASSHTCDTAEGNSGSPLFDISSPDRTQWYIRAIHFAGLTDKSDNLAIPIDDRIFTWMACYRDNQSGCAVASKQPEKKAPASGR